MQCVVIAVHQLYYSVGGQSTPHNSPQHHYQHIHAINNDPYNYTIDRLQWIEHELVCVLGNQSWHVL